MYQGPQDQRVLSGVMDQESSAWSIAPENYRYAVNLINVNNRQQGSWTNIISTLEIINPFLRSGVNKCVGAFEDVRNDSIIYFVYNSLGYDGVYRWYNNVAGAANGVIEKVYQVFSPSFYTLYNPNPLGFDPDYLIAGVNLADDLLLWTDYNRSPKCMNIKRANLTGKRKEYNLYFNPNLTFPTVFTINTYTQGNPLPTQTITWASNLLTIDNIISNCLTAYANNAGITLAVKLEDKGNYIHATLLQEGDQYSIEITSTAPTWGAIFVADNFYPDGNGIAPSPSPLSEQLIERVKYPPLCAPTGRFQATGNLGSFNAQVANVVLQNTIQPDLISYYTWYNYSGLSVISDPLGYINAGGTNQQGPFSPGGPYNVFAGYFVNNNPFPITVIFTVELAITVVGFAGGFTPTNPSWLFYLSTQTNASIPPSNPQTLWQWTSAYGGGQTYNITATIQRTMQPTEEVGLFSTNAGLSGSYTGTIFGNVFSAGYNNFLSDTYPRFRAKYIYKDNQQSVYSAISDTVVPLNGGQNEVLVDFTDKRLEDVELVSDIKNVVLAVSKDNGTTWYDFVTLEQWQFAGVGMQKYLYTGVEALIPVSTSEAILQYHDVPLLSKAQEYVDDRVWDGGIVKGYDKVDINIDIDINYEFLAIDPLYSFSLIEPPASISYWRRGWRGYIGIAYYDDADRKTAVCIDPNNSRIEIPYYNETQTLDPAYLTLRVYNEAPQWATKYRFVRSQDMSQSSYLIWCADELEYVNEDDSIVSPTPVASTKYIRIGIANIEFYVDKIYKGAKTSFTYVDGDRVRFIMNTAGTYFQQNDYVIAKVDTTYVYVAYDGSIGPASGSSPALAQGAMLEFYSPRPQIEKPLFYEFGDCYRIMPLYSDGLTLKIHEGGVTNQTWANSPYFLSQFASPATSDLKTGDVWFRNRRLFFNTSTIPGYGERTRFISSLYPSEYTDQVHDNNGRTNATDVLGRVYYDTGIGFSDQYISGTRINGLNAVQPANTKQFNTIYGLIYKMQVINNDILRIIFGNGYQLSIYVNQGVIRQSQGGPAIISILDEVAANSHMIQRTMGTVNPESVVVNDEGDVMGYDEIEGVCWMSAGNGTVDISAYFMGSTWHEYGYQRRRLDRKKSFAPAVYDLEKDLYVVSLNTMPDTQEVLPSFNIKLPTFADTTAQFNIVLTPNNTVIYNGTSSSSSWYGILLQALVPAGYNVAIESDGSVTVTAPALLGYEQSVMVITVLYFGERFVFTYPFTGGQAGGTNGTFEGKTLTYAKRKRGWVNYYDFNPEYYGRLRNQIAGFVDGKMYLHETGVGYNNFYGVQYGSRLGYVQNKDFPKVKNMLSQWYRGIGKWGAKLFNAPTGSYPWGQETEMTPSHFELQEDGYYASVLKNKLDPRFPNQDEAWVNGEDIVGDAPLIEMYNDETTEARLDTTKTLYLYSENS